MVLEAGKSDVKVPADSVPAVSSFTGFQMATFLLFPHVVEKERALVSLPFLLFPPLPAGFINI